MKQPTARPDQKSSGVPARAVVIHGHAHALAALQAARQHPCRLTLLSAPNAASFLGPAWWAALLAALHPQMVAANATDLLDCGRSAGRAMEALRIGLRRLVLTADCPQFEAVLARAVPLGAELAPTRPDALDLAGKNALRRLPEWLRDGSPGSREPAR